MKVFFLASPRSLETMRDTLVQIYDDVTALGYTHTSDLMMRLDPKEFYAENSPLVAEFYEEVNKQIKAADVCIFETTVPTLGIGHLLYMAVTLGKPTIVLYQNDKKPLMPSELGDERVQVIKYVPTETRKVLEAALIFAKDQGDTRFNFFISPKHQNYLDWISKHRHVPRSVYLRSLIQNDMRANKDFQ